jgi:hypothetical protein
VRVHVEDGRYYLQTTDQQYDLITSEPPPPKTVGVVALYTKEYFELMRRRLKPGGLVSYWLPAHALDPWEGKAIVRAFCDVFPDCSMWNGADYEWIMIGSRGGIAPMDEARLRGMWSDPVLGPTLRELGYEAPEQLITSFMADAGQLQAWSAGIQPVTDNWPKRIADSLDQTQGLWYMEPAQTGTVRPRFEQSAFIAEHLPESLRQASLPYFEHQDAINLGISHARSPGAVFRPRILYKLLTQTSLRELPLWFTGSDAYSQHAAKVARAKGRQHPMLDYQAGAAAIADRQYQLAAEAFRSAMERGGPKRRTWQWYLFSLAMAGQLDQAQQLAQIGVENPDARHKLDGTFFEFLTETFPGTTWPDVAVESTIRN